MRQAAKRLYEELLVRAMGDPQRMVGRSIILAYHNIVPDDMAVGGDRSLHLPFSRFLAQLDLIQTFCHVCDLTSILTEHSIGDRPRVALTFDDAYCGAVQFGLPELSVRNLPNTLFVAPGLLGSRSFWWDDLASNREGIPISVRNEALERWGGRSDLIRAGLRSAQGPRQLPIYFACASEAQVRDTRALSHTTLGAHTWSHPNLTRLSESELVLELSRPLEWLRASGVRVTPMIAYPYGLSSPHVQVAAARAGYVAGLSVEGGWLEPRLRHPFATPRFNVPAGLSDKGFLLSLSGRC